MPKPSAYITPPDRLEKWKKLWATPRAASDEETEKGFEEFLDEFVPSHMHKLFRKSFGVPKVKFGNRFFKGDAQYLKWDTKLSMLMGVGEHVSVLAIYASGDEIEGYQLRGERRRTLRDIIIDDWVASCAIVRGDEKTVYVFVEEKMRGCIVRVLGGDLAEEVDTTPQFVEFEESE